jgi:hypothetical protein
VLCHFVVLKPCGASIGNEGRHCQRTASRSLFNSVIIVRVSSEITNLDQGYNCFFTLIVLKNVKCFV